MHKVSSPIYLASKSPRRRKLLKQLNLQFKALQVDIEEKVLKGENPKATVKRLSLEKNKLAVKKIQNGIVISADTIVVLNKTILGKPRNKEDAFRILKLLSGKTHKVFTGFTITNIEKNKTLTDYEITSVSFRELSNKEITDYVKTGSPMDKAGAYGIQDDFGAVFVKKISGCYYNVVGLPLAKLYQTLLKVI